MKLRYIFSKPALSIGLITVTLLFGLIVLLPVELRFFTQLKCVVLGQGDTDSRACLTKPISRRQSLIELKSYIAEMRHEFEEQRSDAAETAKLLRETTKLRDTISDIDRRIDDSTLQSVRANLALRQRQLTAYKQILGPIDRIEERIDAQIFSVRIDSATADRIFKDFAAILRHYNSIIDSVVADGRH